MNCINDFEVLAINDFRQKELAVPQWAKEEHLEINCSLKELRNILRSIINRD